MEGVKNVAQAERILSLGVEKIAISSAIVKNPKLINSFLIVWELKVYV